MSLKPFWNEQCETLVHALDAGDSIRIALPQTGAAEPAQTSGATTSVCQEEECSEPAQTSGATTSVCQEECSEPARGRLCDAHRDMAQADSCYVILRVGKRKGERCGTRAKGDGLCGRHTPKQAAPSNVAIRSRMIKLYPTPAYSQPLGIFSTCLSVVLMPMPLLLARRYSCIRSAAVLVRNAHQRRSSTLLMLRYALDRTVSHFQLRARVRVPGRLVNKSHMVILFKAPEKRLATQARAGRLRRVVVWRLKSLKASSVLIQIVYVVA